MATTSIVASFKAVMDRIPGQTPALVVTGEVRVPTTGWTVSMRPAGHDRGRHLHLEIEAVPPRGPAGDIVETLAVQYRESPPHYPYDEVTVRDGTQSFSLPVPVLV